ncbi:MAG: hypothetical protein RIT27_169 [Pseudomonadota bacterium]|jgi:hypothetical protein
MEIIHKVISVPDDHKVMLVLPKNIPVGDVEVVLIINPKKMLEAPHGAAHHASTSISSTSLRDAAISKLASLFDEQQQLQQQQTDKDN